MNFFITSILFLIFFPYTLLANVLDLEMDWKQNFVLETKKIEIPGFPYAFNPSIVKWKDSILMSFRAGKDYTNPQEDFDSGCEESNVFFPPDKESTYSPNRIGLVWLDEDFNLLSLPQILEIPFQIENYRQQDPRLVVAGEKLYIAYCDVIMGVKIPSTRRMFIAELLHDGKAFFMNGTECLAEFEDENELRWEKNWAPFDYKGNLLLSYSINPHRVLYPKLGQGCCETIASSKATLSWEWGELRGGTPALQDGEEYLAFFHSCKKIASAQSNEVEMIHYFMGAYTFSSTPPFSLTSVSPLPIVGENFYNGLAHKTWKPLRVVFPCGYIMNKDYVWVSYGRQDHEIWIAKLDKAQLRKSMIPICSQ